MVTDVAGFRRGTSGTPLKQAPNLSLEKPYHSGNDIDACILFYNDACQHGLVGSDHSGPDLKACVDAITNDMTGWILASRVLSGLVSGALRMLQITWRRMATQLVHRGGFRA